MHIDVYSDGSATIATSPGGWGWVLVVDGIKHSEGLGYMVAATNNDAELEAAIQGLRAARIIAGINKASVTLVSDSQIILGWATGKFAFRQQDKIAKYKEFQMLIQIMHVKTRWVEGHTGDEHNERCDKLANIGRKGESIPLEASPALSNAIGQALPFTRIGIRDKGILCVWWNNSLKLIDLEYKIIEDYNELVHGKRNSKLVIKE